MLIVQDLKRKQQIYGEDGAPTSLFKIFLSDGTSAMVLYRCMNYLAQKKLKLAAFPIQWLNKFINGCVIGIDAHFKAGFVIMHPVGVVINSKVRGDNNITLEAGVVIGDEKGLSPRLGENIFIGSGAKVLGLVTIGNNVKIGANAVVVKDVPANHIAVGIPAVNKPQKNK